MSDVEEIKNRISIADLVGEYVRLQKAGSNHRALCPFHNEKTPSFMVSDEKGIWHCFGCGKGGDIFSFLMEIEGVGFREALTQLAEKAGVQLKRSESWEARGEDKKDKNKLFAILELATKWYEKNLWEGKGKEKILGYLRERGLTDESIRKFRLGYAPDGWRNLLEFLVKKNYDIEDIAKTGLLVDKSQESNIPNASYQLPATSHYDRFRDRIIFPIQDIMGRVVGYSARVAPGGDEKNAKYVNTPQTVLYDKSRILYGLNFSKMDMKKSDETVLVEGNMDVIAAHQAGLPNTIAVSGTALTPDQVKILKRYSENIKMGFDMDAAGQAAARRSIKTCLENDLNVKIISLASGKDAAESIKERPQIWKKAVESATGVMEYYFQEIFSRYDAKKPTEKKKVAKELLDVIKDISNPVEQAHWVAELAARIGTDEKILFDVLKKTKEREKKGAVSERETEVKGDKRKGSTEAKILGILLAYPGECRKAAAKIKIDDFQEENERAIMKLIKENAQNYSLEKVKALFSDYETQKFLSELAFEAEVRFGGALDENQERPDPGEELKGYIRRLKDKNIREKFSRIARDIKAAEASGDKEGTKLLMAEFQKLAEERGEDGG